MKSGDMALVYVIAKMQKGRCKIIKEYNIEGNFGQPKNSSL